MREYIHYGSKELHKIIETFCNGLYFKLYGWDCDSILILNDNAIEVVS